MSSEAKRTTWPRRSKKIELSNGDDGTKNNDNDEMVLVVPECRALPFLSHNSLCTPVSNNDTARAYLMHCDKEFKESAEERFHPDPSLTTEERERERGGRGEEVMCEGRKAAKENAREVREAHRESV